MKKFKLFKMLAVLIVLITSINTAWGWGSSDGTVVYFDRQNCTSLFTTGPYFRIGDDGWNNKYDMYIVPGTKYLYYHNLGSYTYGAFAVANGYGWVGSGDGKSIYQPSDKQYGKEGYSGGAVISQQTEYYKQNISGNFYIKLTGGTGNYDYGCQYYQYEHGELPTYSVSYSKTGSGTLTVQQYTGSTYTALASGTTGLKPTQIIKITTSPSTDYALASLTVTGATQIDGGDTYYITDNCTISATFEYQWAVKGSGTEMGAWGTFWGLAPTATDNEYEGTVTLAANSIYEFVVTDRRTSTDYKYGDSGYHLTFSGQSSAPNHDLETGDKQNLVIMSAGAGTYTFTWNKSTKRLKVKFPTVTHPSTDYIYFKHTQGWNVTDYVICSHIWGGGTKSTAWERLPTNDSFNFDGTTYYYTALGNNTTALFAGSQNTSANQTENLTNLGTLGTKRGKYYDYTSGADEDARWQEFKATVSLDHQAATNTPAPNSITVTYGASTNLTGNIITTTPTKDGYNFGGYYTQKGGVGDQFIATNENVNTNVPNYTDGSKNWIKTGSSVSTTIYAKWTQNVTLDKNGTNSEYRSNGSLTATYNNAGPFAITTAPVRVGYSVEGYYADDACTHKVMTAAGALVNYTGYVEDGKWVHAGATTLYTKWTPDYFVIYRSGDMDGESRTTSDAVYIYAGGTIPKPIEYRMKVSELNKWYTLCLPFEVNAVKVWGGTEYLPIYPCHRPSKGETLRQGYYVIRTPDSEEKSGSSVQIELNNFGDWVDPFYYDGYVPSANTPYIIQWNMSYFDGKYISFFGAAGQTIPAAMSGVEAPTDEYIKICGNNSMTNGSVAGVYLLDNDYGAGAWLRAEDVEEERTIHPFECYLLASESTTANNMVIKRRTGEDSATGWEEILNYERKDVITVYTITGYKVAQYENCSFDEAGRRMNGELSEGIYIMNAGNESVKLIIR